MVLAVALALAVTAFAVFNPNIWTSWFAVAKSTAESFVIGDAGAVEAAEDAAEDEKEKRQAAKKAADDAKKKATEDAASRGGVGSSPLEYEAVEASYATLDDALAANDRDADDDGNDSDKAGPEPAGQAVDHTQQIYIFSKLKIVIS